MRDQKGRFIKGHVGIGNVFREGHAVTENSRRMSREVNLGQRRNWKGGKIVELGYILVKDKSHPFGDYRGYIRQHRLVVEKYIGRYLKISERVHHLNGVKTDNDQSNLICFSSESAHQRFHHNELNVREDEIIFDGRKLT